MSFITKRRGLTTLCRFHEQLFGGAKRVELPGGAQLVIPDDPHYFGFFLGLHESHITDVIGNNIREGDVCIDVGANIGYFSMIMAKKAGPSGKVFAFEPVPQTFDALNANAMLAGIDGLNIVANQAAISEEVGELALELKEHSTLNQVRRIQADSDLSTDRVKCLSLESFLLQQDLSRGIALLKIDVEGHEVSVLHGAMSVLKSGQVRQLIIEVTPGEDAVQIDRLLAECGAATRTWDGRAWSDTSVKDLYFRTDVLATF